MRLRFDRGTLLLEAPRGWPPAANLPLALWDPRVGAYRAPAFEHGRLLEALKEAGVRNPGSNAHEWAPLDLRPSPRIHVRKEVTPRRDPVAPPRLTRSRVLRGQCRGVRDRTGSPLDADQESQGLEHDRTLAVLRRTSQREANPSVFADLGARIVLVSAISTTSASTQLATSATLEGMLPTLVPKLRDIRFELRDSRFERLVASKGAVDSLAESLHVGAKTLHVGREIIEPPAVVLHIAREPPDRPHDVAESRLGVWFAIPVSLRGHRGL